MQELDMALSSDTNRCDILLVFSPTVEQAMPSFDFLFGLHDSHFKELRLSFDVTEDDAGELPIWPLTNRCLEKLLLQNEKRAIYSTVWLSHQSNLAYLQLVEQTWHRT
jgi:hypothetical protein